MLNGVIKMKTIKEKYELVTKPTWTYTDIMDWCEVSKATAIKIKNRAINEFDGLVKYGTHHVKTDSVLAIFGTTREREYQLLKGLLNE